MVGNAALRAAVGDAGREPLHRSAAAHFERGTMYWLSSPAGQVIYVIATEPSGRRSYRAYTDSWREGDPATVGLNPPAGSQDGLFDNGK